MTLNATILGGSGFTGGELARLLISHPEIELNQITSRTFLGKPITRVNPNLRGFSKMKFTNPDELKETDVLFLCLPHGSSAKAFEKLKSVAPKIIDLSSDFRLHNNQLHKKYYPSIEREVGSEEAFAYGIAEINREKISQSDYVATAGCNATATILGLAPLQEFIRKIERLVVDVKVGTSESGRQSKDLSYSERVGSIRSYRPTHHRHIAEVIEYLYIPEKKIHFTATALNHVRGVLATIHCFIDSDFDDKLLWKLFRKKYNNEPFIRLVKENKGYHRYPDPKNTVGTNFCDIGFEIDPNSNRIVIISALDNLMKGAAGQAIQAMNLMLGFDEKMGLYYPSIFPS